MGERRKLCRACGETKPHSDFGPHRNNHTDGLQSYCRVCKNARHRAYLRGYALKPPPPRERVPLIDLTKPSPGPSKVHSCGNALVFGTVDGHGYEWCGRCRTQVAFGR